MKEIIFCNITQKPSRVDIYVSTLFSDMTRAYIQKLIKKGKITINNKVVSKNAKVQYKDQIQINIYVEQVDIMPQDISIDIISENDNFLVINKTPGMNVHPVPGEGGNKNTLVNALLYRYSDNLPVISGEARPGIVHRLDKDTSGVMFIAKNDTAMQELSSAFHDREVDKYYLTIVHGKPSRDHFIIESDIGRDRVDRTKMTVSSPINSKYAKSIVWTLHENNEQNVTLLLVKIETGRTHQIRVHLSSIGLPIVGDKVYGNKILDEKFNFINRQQLHSYISKIEIFGQKHIFQAPLQADMRELCETIGFDIEMQYNQVNNCLK